VLRADVSGWPFTGQVTWFTASLVLFPALVAGILLLRGRTWARVALAAALLVAVQGPHMFWSCWPARPAGGAGPAGRRAAGAAHLPAVTVPVRQGGRVVDEPLEGFLRSTGTTAFLAVKGDTLVSEVYFHGYRITLRHLLTMTSGLADLDPYYDLDLRAVALRQTTVVEPPGRRFHHNNVNPVLLGLVLERTTGEPVSAYLSERLWGPLGMEAGGSWSLDSRRSGLELLQAGLNGRPVDFAKLGALYLHRGAWRGRQLVPRAWVADSTRVVTRTDPSPRFQYCWWTGPGTGPPDDYWAQGNHGQFIYVAPSRDLVLVRFGTDYHYDHWPSRSRRPCRR
jgi:hypothetical protein